MSRFDTSAAWTHKSIYCLHLSRTPLMFHIHECCFSYYYFRTHFIATRMCDDEVKRKKKYFTDFEWMKVKVGEVLCFIALITCLWSAANFFSVLLIVYSSFFGLCGNSSSGLLYFRFLCYAIEYLTAIITLLSRDYSKAALSLNSCQIAS